jgi:hypothetical protein
VACAGLLGILHILHVYPDVFLSVMLLLQGTRLTSLRSTARASTNSLGPRLGLEPLHLPPRAGGHKHGWIQLFQCWATRFRRGIGQDGWKADGTGYLLASKQQSSTACVCALGLGL